MRLKGGFASFKIPARTAMRGSALGGIQGSPATSSKGKVLAGMSFGRLRGGHSSLRMSSVAEPTSAASNPPPAVVKDGEMAPQYDPQAVEQELYQVQNAIPQPLRPLVPTMPMWTAPP